MYSILNFTRTYRALGIIFYKAFGWSINIKIRLGVSGRPPWYGRSGFRWLENATSMIFFARDIVLGSNHK